MSARTPVFACLLTLAAAPVARAGETILSQDAFTAPTLSPWSVATTSTETSFTKAAPGDSWVDINKADTCGIATFSRDFPVPAGHYLRVSADLRSQYVGPFAEYLLRAVQLDANGKTIEDSNFAFDDGFSVSSVFGGAFKTPQTLGEWKRTRHQLKVAPATVTLRLSFTFRTGEQHLQLDNFVLEDLGTAEPAVHNLPFYFKPLDSAAGLLDLDTLLPGVTYEITAETASPEHEGMDLAASWLDLKGQGSEPQPLHLIRTDGNALVYSYTVPDRAMGVRLDLRNSDLTRLGWNHENEYRRWKSVSIRTLSMPPAPDTLFYNYTRNVAKDPSLIKPREMVDVSEFDRAALDGEMARRPIEDAEVAILNGAPALRIGGHWTPAIMNASLGTQNRYDVYGALGRNGLNLIRVEDPPGGPGMNGQWLADGKFDFSSVDTQIYGALKQNPQARIIYMINGLFPPDWWGEAHPDEILRDSSGLALAQEDKPFAYRRRWGRMEDAKFRAYVRQKNGCYFPSPASAAYREAMHSYLAALRNYIESRPYGNAVVGYKLVWGYDGQWGWPVSGSNADEIFGVGKTPPHDADYSAPMRAYFQAFLRKRYADETALRKAWGDTAVTFASAAIPGPAQRDPSLDAANAKPYRYFLDPAKQRQVIDFNACYADVVGDLLNDMAATIKAAAPRKILTLAYFQDIQRDLGEAKVLDSPALDISGGPIYDAREVGQSGLSAHLYSSFALHGKLDFTEVDHRLFSTIYRNYRGNQVFETPRKSLSVLQREFGRQMVTGGGAWTLDMGLGWFSQPLIAEEMGQIRAVFEKAMTANRTSSAKMALFIGDYAWQTRQSPRFNLRPYFFAKYLRATLAQCGAPVDVYQLADLPKVAVQYKVFLFPFAQGLTDRDRANIETLKRNGNFLVFGPAAGYAGDSKLDAGQVASLIGMQVERDDTLPFTVLVKEANLPLTKDLRGYIGSDEADHKTTDFPMFAVADPKATTVAEYADRPGRTGIAYKDLGDWKSLYLGAVGIYPTELFRGIARQAGVHLYSEDGDALWADQGLVAVHASSDGVKTISLPAPAHVTSLWDNRDLGMISTIRRPMRTGDNALYLLEPQ